MNPPSFFGGRWREVWILAGVPLNVVALWAAQFMNWRPFGNEQWILGWGVGAFYAIAVLVPWGWFRGHSLLSILFSAFLSVLAWHWAARLAIESYHPLAQSGQDAWFLLRTTLSGAFGAMLTLLVPMSHGFVPGWEKRLPIIGAVGGGCGLYMAVLCLWKFEVGFWLGLVGWQLVVTSVGWALSHRKSSPPVWEPLTPYRSV